MVYSLLRKTAPVDHARQLEEEEREYMRDDLALREDLQ
jgi:hypothetical protein